MKSKRFSISLDTDTQMHADALLVELAAPTMAGLLSRAVRLGLIEIDRQVAEEARARLGRSEARIEDDLEQRRRG